MTHVLFELLLLKQEKTKFWLRRVKQPEEQREGKKAKEKILFLKIK